MSESTKSVLGARGFRREYGKDAGRCALSTGSTSMSPRERLSLSRGRAVAENRPCCTCSVDWYDPPAERWWTKGRRMDHMRREAARSPTTAAFGPCRLRLRAGSLGITLDRLGEFVVDGEVDRAKVEVPRVSGPFVGLDNDVASGINGHLSGPDRSYVETDAIAMGNLIRPGGRQFSGNVNTG